MIIRNRTLCSNYTVQNFRINKLIELNDKGQTYGNLSSTKISNNQLTQRNKLSL